MPLPSLSATALIFCSEATSLNWMESTLLSQGLRIELCRSREELQQALVQCHHRLLIWHKAEALMDMQDFCRVVREQNKFGVALVIADQHIEVDHISCLELGASDYMADCYSPLELKARLRAHLFRTESLFQQFQTQQSNSQILCRGLSVNIDRRSVHFMGQELCLTAKEFNILNTLISRPGQVFTRDQLLDAVWGQGSESYAHTVSTHINRLRGKLESINDDIKFIHTLWGVGYKFCDCYDSHMPS